MAISDTITSLGTAIIGLANKRANKDLSNLTTTGENKIKTVAATVASGVPVGTVIAYMGTTIPDGYLLMDGRNVSRTTYSALFNVVGTSMGAGDGSTTFTIADMTDGRYLMGSTVAGSRLSAGLPNITGSFCILPQDEKVEGCFYIKTVPTYKRASWGDGHANTTKQAGFDASLDGNTIYGNSSTVTPKSYTTVFLIKY